MVVKVWLTFNIQTVWVNSKVWKKLGLLKCYFFWQHGHQVGSSNLKLARVKAQIEVDYQILSFNPEMERRLNFNL